MTDCTRWVGQVWRADTKDLLARLPSCGIDEIISDVMHGTSSQMCYDWGYDEARGDLEEEQVQPLLAGIVSLGPY